MLSDKTIRGGAYRSSPLPPPVRREPSSYPFPQMDRLDASYDSIDIGVGRPGPSATSSKSLWGPLSPRSLFAPSTPGAAPERPEPLAPARRRHFLRLSEDRQSWRPAATLLSVLVGNFVMTQGAALYAHGGVKPNAPYTYTPDSGGGATAHSPPPNAGGPSSVPHGPGGEHLRPLGMCLMAAGVAISLSGSATFTYLSWQLARTRVFIFFAMSVFGFGAAVSGYYMRQMGAERDDIALVQRSVALRVLATTVLFYCIPRSFSSAEIVLANVLRNGWQREQAAICSFALGGGLVVLWTSMPILNTNPWLIQTVATTSSLLLITGFSLRGTDVERARARPPQTIVEVDERAAEQVCEADRGELLMVMSPGAVVPRETDAPLASALNRRRHSLGPSLANFRALGEGSQLFAPRPFSKKKKTRFEEVEIEESSTRGAASARPPRLTPGEMV